MKFPCNKFNFYQAEKEKKLRAMGRALADLKQELLVAAQEGANLVGQGKAEEDAEERRRLDKDIIQVKKIHPLLIMIFNLLAFDDFRVTD